MVDGLKRVVVTGMGITSCLGNDLDTVAENLKNAKYASRPCLEPACGPCFLCAHLYLTSWSCRSGIRYRQEFADFGIKSHLCGWPDLTEVSAMS